MICVNCARLKDINWLASARDIGKIKRTEHCRDVGLEIWLIKNEQNQGNEKRGAYEIDVQKGNIVYTKKNWMLHGKRITLEKQNE